MESVLKSMFDWLCNNLGILGIFISLGIIMFWWVIAIVAVLAVIGLIIGICVGLVMLWDGILFLRHPIANYRKMKEARRLAEQERVRRAAEYHYEPSCGSGSSDDSSSGSDSSGGEPNNGGGPDEYGPSPGYGGMGGP